MAQRAAQARKRALLNGWPEKVRLAHASAGGSHSAFELIDWAAAGTICATEESCVSTRRCCEHRIIGDFNGTMRSKSVRRT